MIYSHRDAIFFWQPWWFKAKTSQSWWHPLRTLPLTLDQCWSVDLQMLYRTSMHEFPDLDLEQVVGRYYSYCAYFVAISFGSPSCPISPADFHLTHLLLQCSLCFLRPQTGANQARSSETPWCMSCLVYFVPLCWYNTDCRTTCTWCSRIPPPEIGLPQLSGTVLAVDEVNRNPPSTTIGFVPSIIGNTFDCIHLGVNLCPLVCYMRVMYGSSHLPLFRNDV